MSDGNNSVTEHFLTVVNDNIKCKKIYDNYLGVTFIIKQGDAFSESDLNTSEEVDCPYIRRVDKISMMNDECTLLYKSDCEKTLKNVLYDSIIECRNFDESILLKYFVNLLTGLNHLHSSGVVCGSLCLDTIVLTKDDFLSILILPNLPTGKEQLSYAAPEVLNGAKPTFKSDIWSLGVVLYVLYTKELPFVSFSREGLVKEIASNNHDSFIDSMKFPTDSYTIKDIIQVMLHTSEDCRPSAQELMNIRLVRDYMETNVVKSDDDESTNNKLDLIFMIDGTEGNEEYIELVRNEIASCYNTLVDNYNFSVRMGYVVYRDPVDDPSTENTYCDMSSKYEKVISALSMESAYGGGDPSEDVAGGYEIILNKLKIRENAKVFIVHITNVPAHGFGRYNNQHPEERSRTETLSNEIGARGYTIIVPVLCVDVGEFVEALKASRTKNKLPATIIKVAVKREVEMVSMSLERMEHEIEGIVAK